MTKRKPRSKSWDTRSKLLDVTEKLMRDEGYAAVSTRKVAKAAGLTPGVLHYYFPNTDDLFVALYRRMVETLHRRITATLASDRPLRALWSLYTDPEHIRLQLEFIALANHRKVIRGEIARNHDYIRGLEAGAFARILRTSHGEATVETAVAMSVVVEAIARLIVMDKGLEIFTGHREAEVFTERLLSWMEGEADGSPPSPLK
jgi:AcrR family transcriptional regulator